jgi:hypothetical protein
MRSSAEVFSNDWNIYNLADPRFVTFYNYGGWILLDSEYSRERPRPRASTVAEWQAFFANHGIRYAILHRRQDTEDLFQNTPRDWRPLFRDEQLTVWRVQGL